MTSDANTTRSDEPRNSTFEPDLDAGLAAAFGPDLTTGGWSQPPLLRDDPSDYSPVVRPSPEMPRAASDRYQLLGEIARGGMGAVLKGRDPDLGRDLAIKVLRADLAGKPGAVRRFVEEAQVCGQLQHPGVVPVYDLGRLADGRPYFAMKLVRGRTLANLLAERKDPGDGRGRLLQVFLQVCQAVAYAHAVGVIHRDLKPSNVMVGGFGEVQVMDWGLSKVLPRGGVADERKADPAGRRPEGDGAGIRTARSGGGSETVAGSVMGTPGFMSPEQAAGEVDRLDERTDVFGLGAVLCVILTGFPPFAGPTPEATRQMAVRGNLDEAFTRLAACGADAEVAELCRRCLAADQNARPRSAGEVAGAVAAYLAEVERRAHRAEVARAAAEARAAEERKRRRVQAALTAVVGVSLLGTVAGQWWLNAVRVGAAREEVEVARVQIARERDRAARDWAERADPPSALSRGEASRAFKRDRDVWVIAFSPDGRRVATADGDGAARLWRTLPLQDDGGPDRAVAAFREAVRRDPTDATARSNLGAALQAKGEVDEAVAAYREAVRLDPGFAPAHTNLGAALLARGEPDGAVAAHRAAIRADPQFALAHTNLGNALLARGDLRGAVAALREAVRLDPGDAAAHSNLGDALQRSGRLTEAAAVCREAVRLDPGNAAAHARLGQVLLGSGDLPGARAALAEAARLDPRWAAKLGPVPPVEVAPPPREVKR